MRTGMPANQDHKNNAHFWQRPLFVLIAASLIVFTSFGIRQSFGLFMYPITHDLGWGRETLSIAFATQQLMIGISAPFAGAIADRWGGPKTVALGGGIFALGVLIMSQSTQPETIFASAGIMAGIGLGACGLPLMLAIVGQVAPPEKRSLWLGIGTATATGGQLLIVPMSSTLLSGFDWVVALLALSAMAGLIVPMAFSMTAALKTQSHKDTDMNLRQAIGEAVSHRGFALLTAGFYVCGFQIAFMAMHLPAYLTDQGASTALGATALMLIALFNMGGSWGAGWLGGRVPKKYALSAIYVVRSLLVMAFISVPTTPVTIVLFAASIGLLWLSTVPLTSGLVAQIFGTRYMGMLYGVVYLSHQLGSFTGVWLGGRLFDATGSYAAVWWVAIALGFVSALLHLPIDDKPLGRLMRPAE